MKMHSIARCLPVALLAASGCGDTTHPTPVSAQSPAASARSSASSAAPPGKTAQAVALPKCSLRPVTWAGFSPDAKWLLTAGAPEDTSGQEGPIKDGSIEIWSVERGERTGSLDLGNAKLPERPLVLAFSPDANTVLIAGMYGTTTRTIALGDLSLGATRFVDGALFPLSAEVSRDGKVGVVGGGAAEVVSLELPSGRVYARLPYSEGHTAANSVLSSDGSVVLREDGSQELAFLSTKTLEATLKMSAASGPDWAVPISPDRTKVAVLNEKGAAILDATTGKERVRLKGAPVVNPMSDLVWFSPSGGAVALLTSTDELYLWSAADGAPVGSGKAKLGVALEERKLQWSPDGAVIIAGRNVIDAAKAMPLRALDGAFVTWVDGHEIVTASAGRLVRTGEAAAPIATWPAPDLADATPTWSSANGLLIAYVPKGDTHVRVIRMSDGAAVDLFTTTEHAGFVVRAGDKATYDGPAAAKTCPAAQAGAGATARPGLLKDFLALRPLD